MIVGDGLGRRVEIPLVLRAAHDSIETVADDLEPLKRLELTLGLDVEEVVDVELQQSAEVLRRAGAPPLPRLEA